MITDERSWYLMKVCAFCVDSSVLTFSALLACATSQSCCPVTLNTVSWRLQGMIIIVKEELSSSSTEY